MPRSRIQPIPDIFRPVMECPEEFSANVAYLVRVRDGAHEEPEARALAGRVLAEIGEDRVRWILEMEADD